ncbi:DUF4153 domain-containing protein [Pedobacter insulae]|uniref:Uncharacterized protein n=1 Tax=Pedobacter insulae TaxID=414048 RepID=A0A1I2VMP0_9SPHI|nr:DUF4173 domain-containing protein [Pedobacter insulae]SFG88776.1 protein of unknown function [Pedobacter insulae]
MTYKIDKNLIIVILSGLLFNYLFWMESLALNLFLYSLFILTVYLFTKDIRSKKLLVIAASHLIASILVVINQSDLTILTWYISLFVLVGYTHYPQLRSICTALLVSILQFTTAPFSLFKKVIEIEIGSVTLRPTLKLIKYLIFPTFILFLFSIIYSIANPVFSSYLTNFSENIAQLFTHIFEFFFKDIKLERILFLLLGILFSTGVFICFKHGLASMECNLKNHLVRTRRQKKELTIYSEISMLFIGNLKSKKMALKTEHTIAVISFIGLNTLLLFLNAIDFSTLWVGDIGSVDFSLALHGSTNALIISIVMAMCVILYFFNGNLNFYCKNKTLRILAYCWIVQNIFLVLSVLIRDYHYIDMHGLTYKRIGVIVFSLLCSIGLITVYIKVAKQKTFFYLYSINSLSWYALLILFSTINWDVFIVSYNLKHKNATDLDVNHLMSMSNKTLPLLFENRELLKKYLSPTNASTSYFLVNAFEQDLALRVEMFEKEWNRTTWLSWNYRDWQTMQYLAKNNLRQNNRKK